MTEFQKLLLKGGAKAKKGKKKGAKKGSKKKK
jgi:hypothetical protein